MLILKRTILAVTFFLCSTGIFGAGIGPCADINAGFSDDSPVFEAGAGFSVRMENHPAVFNIATDYSVFNRSVNVYETMDYWFFNPELSDYCSFFAGAGELIGLSFSLKEAALELGVRAVCGFSWIFYDGFMEPFVQIAVQPEERFGNTNEFILKFPVNAGVRFYY